MTITKNTLLELLVNQYFSIKVKIKIKGYALWGWINFGVFGVLGELGKYFISEQVFKR